MANRPERRKARNTKPRRSGGHLALCDRREDERPREMLLARGAENVNLGTLLAIILRTGQLGESAEDLGHRLLAKFGTLRAMAAAKDEEFREIKGIGPAKVAELRAAIELGRRFARERQDRRAGISSPEEVLAYAAEFYGPYLRDAVKEHFQVILLNTKNAPLAHVPLTVGTLAGCPVDPKEIIREATLRAASAVILVHNHPSGVAEPSADDIELTKTVSAACATVGLRLLDHIIIGKNTDECCSMAGRGLVKQA